MLNRDRARRALDLINPVLGMGRKLGVGVPAGAL